MIEDTEYLNRYLPRYLSSLPLLTPHTRGVSEGYTSVSTTSPGPQVLDGHHPSVTLYGCIHPRDEAVNTDRSTSVAVTTTYGYADIGGYHHLPDTRSIGSSDPEVQT